MKKKFTLVLFLVSCLSANVFSQLQWNCLYSAGSTGNDEGYSIATDSMNNLIIAGRFSGSCQFGDTSLISGGATDIFLIKKDPLGNVIWAKKAGGTGSDMAYCVRSDWDNNIFLSGYFSGTANFDTITLVSHGGLDIFIAMLNEDGNFIWARQAGGPLDDEGISVAPDNFGNVYLTGTARDTAHFEDTSFVSYGDGDIYLARYDTIGNLKWVNHCGGTNWDVGRGVGTDSLGNIFLSGHFRLSGTFIDTTVSSDGACNIFVSRWDSLGNLIWLNEEGGGSSDRSYALAVSPGGMVTVSGYIGGTAIFRDTSITPFGGKDIFVARYFPDGQFDWVTNAGGVGEDVGNAVFDDGEEIFITGYYNGIATFDDTTLTSAGLTDIFITAIDSAGYFYNTLSAGGTSSDAGQDVIIDQNGIAFTTGFYNGSATFFQTVLSNAGVSDIYVACLDVPTGLVSPVVAQKEGFFIFPNPASDQICFSGIGSNCLLIVTDNYGRKVKVENVNEADPVNVSDLETGIYFIRLISEKLDYNAKLIVIK